MRYITDYHIHSRYSRACSKNLTLSNLAAWARAKGIDVLATSDFTHPSWFREIEDKLEPAEQGLFRVRDAYAKEDGEGAYERAPVPSGGGRDVRFILSTELSCIYKKDGATRRIHLLVLLSGLDAARRLIAGLEGRECNLRSDGRPILGIDARDIVAMTLDADPDGMVIPAHAWTPWFSVFGSQSGFDSLEQCFGDMTPHIHAIETGLSSDPSMNWRISALDDIMLVSNSDAHGLRNLAREANAFDLDTLSYAALMDVLRKRQTDRFPFTIEFFPEEGKYHADGHRACGFSCAPEETERLGGRCPKCGKPLTRGVLGRVHALADRPTAPPRPPKAARFRYIVPLEELIADSLGKTRAAKAVRQAYSETLLSLGPEFDVLLDVPEKDIAAAAGERVAEAVRRMRAGDVRVVAGYDGVFGSVKVFGEEGRSRQGSLDI